MSQVDLLAIDRDEYRNYFDLLAKRLLSKGFQIERAVGVNPYHVEVLASKTKLEANKFGKMNYFILASPLETPDTNTVLNYSARSMKYALDNPDSVLPRGFGRGVLVVPTIVSLDLDDMVKNWISSTFMKKHWAALEFPVLISLKDKRPYYCTKTPFWGGLYYDEVREFVEEHLSFHPTWPTFRTGWVT